ncbi:MAG: glycosyltransferase family 39 protein [Oscillospiraceae bacterium]|nr:glycosyltransferase family 39 protein [Oscillospiraceae bacterium]
MKISKSNLYRIALIAIILLGGFFMGFGIWKEGSGNAYYTAAVKSMLQNFHNFFFASFDAGYITVDKPAFGLWIQCLFGLIFGVHGWSLILAEVVCSMISIALLNHIIGRTFGKPAGLLASFLLATTPIFVAASKTNNLDASLVMMTLFATWALLVASERKSLKLLLLAMFLEGIAFNIKTLEAFMVLPAFVVCYLFATKIKISRKIINSAAALVMLLVVSLCWILAVDLTPAADRSYVGSSSTNSQLELALGYNGIQRIIGMFGGNRGNQFRNNAPIDDSNQSNPLNDISFNGGEQNNSSPNMIPGIGGGIGASEGGQQGPLRLFNAQMASQASWLIPLALFGILALILRYRKVEDENKSESLRHLLLWSVWFISMYGFFCISSFFHRYYLSMFAPAIAALSAIAIVELFRFFKLRSTTAFLLPAAFLITSIVEIIIVNRYTGYRTVLIPVICVLTFISVASLILINILNDLKLLKFLKPAVTIGIIGVLITPFVWTCTTINGVQTTTPTAGPDIRGDMFGGMFGMNGDGNNRRDFQMPNGGDFQLPNGGNFQMPENMNPNEFANGNGFMDGGNANSALIDFINNNPSDNKYLIATMNAGSSEPIILNTDAKVMTIGGFLGSDPSITLEEFIEMVKEGQVKYFLAGGMGGGMGNGAQGQITNWVEQNATVVDYGNGSSTTNMRNSGTLYDLSGLVDN